MLFYPAALPLPTQTLDRVAALIRTHRKSIGSRRRAHDPWRDSDPHRSQRHRPALLFGKHTRHGMNLQAIADARGNLLWVSGAIGGATHDTKAARVWQIPRLLDDHWLFALGDKGYDGLDQDVVATPFKGKDKPGWRKMRDPQWNQCRR